MDTSISYKYTVRFFQYDPSVELFFALGFDTKIPAEDFDKKFNNYGDAIVAAQKWIFDDPVNRKAEVLVEADNGR